MRPASQRFFIHSCIYLLILTISYLATFLGTNSLSVLMCRKAVNQSISQHDKVKWGAICYWNWYCNSLQIIYSIIITLEPRVNVINMLRLPRWDEIIIHRLRIGHTYLTRGHLLRGEAPLGAWLVKCILLLSMSCFFLFPLQMLVIIVFVLFWFWPPCLNCFESRFTFNNRFQ